MSKEIKKGDQFVCVKTVVMSDPEGQIRYNKGFIYNSEEERCITNNLGDTDHSWTKYGVKTKKHFLRLKKY